MQVALLKEQFIYLTSMTVTINNPFANWNSFKSCGVGRDSSVGIVTRYRVGGLWVESPWGRGFPHPSRP